MKLKFFNFMSPPTQNFDKICFWITDFTASLLWVIPMTHMHITLPIHIYLTEYDVITMQKKVQHWWRIISESNRMTQIELKLGQFRTLIMTHRFESPMLKFSLHRNYIIFHHININSKWNMHVSHRYDS